MVLRELIQIYLICDVDHVSVENTTVITKNAKVIRFIVIRPIGMNRAKYFDIISAVVPLILNHNGPA